MMSAVLPTHERRSFVRAFWIALGLVFGALFWAVGSWEGEPFAAVNDPTTVALFGLFGFVRPDMAIRGYRAWNRLVARPFARFATRVTVRACFFVVALASGGQSSLVPERGRSTAWVARAPISDDAYEQPFTGRGRRPAGDGWIQDYVRWAARTRNWWSLALMPFLIFLSLMSGEAVETVFTTIYTLF